MDQAQIQISLDVAAARDANHARIRMLKGGHTREANMALGARIANMVSARKAAGQLEKVPKLVAQLCAVHKS